MSDEYAIASRDELWLGGALVESRLTHGRATRRGDVIEADDARDDELLAACDARLVELRDVIASLGPLRQRGVVEVVRENGIVTQSSTLTIAFGGVSIVTTPEHAAADAEMLRAFASEAPTATADARALPIVWRNGSAAVLFHEAAGHAAEHGHARLAWPSWLRVYDGDADLLAGDAPRAMRRASFRDVPLPRMTRVVATQADAPFALPEERIEVHLIAAGAYEPLLEEVTLRIAIADVVRGGAVQRTKPFELRATRRELARALIGAHGEALRYPGVICSREGQELVVGSFAPVVITAPLAEREGFEPSVEL